MNNRFNLFLLFFFGSIFLVTTLEADDDEDESQRDKKVLSLFSVVRFNNGACTGSDNLNGTCYTSQECAAKGGTNSGSCAAGYGVCCTFTIGCGQTSNENCTYFQSTGAEVGHCRIRICPCNDNICQLRLDFSSFVITGPSTVSTSVAKALNGVVAPGATKSVAEASQCLTDLFSVTSPGGITGPPICGTNSGQHMYVDSSNSCNELAFQLGTNGQGTALATTRTWNIKVTQYDCNYDNLAPEGCTQYFFGSNTQTVQTYNFDGGYHLANQDQNICIRRERSNCRICWTTAAPTDFQLSGKNSQMSGLISGSMCCGYGTAGTGTSGFDCVMIPGAVKMTATTPLSANAFCGRSAGLVTAKGTMAATICSTTMPFNIRFLSDNYEFGGALLEAMDPTEQKGFKLTYIQTAC